MSGRRIATIAVVSLFLSSIAVAQDGSAANKPSTAPAPSAATDPKPKTENDIISEQLASTDVATQQAAIIRLHARLAQRSGTRLGFQATWIATLAAEKRFDDAESLAVEGILYGPTDAVRISAIQRARVKAFSASGKLDAALSAAKGYYNVCSMEKTEDAINLLGGVLTKARPEQKDIAQQLKDQQIAAADIHPTTAPAGVTDNILKSIVIDATPFADAIEKYDGPNYTHQTAKGNLLLLSDRGKEAKECFEAAVKIAKNQVEMAHATEGIARAIRADTNSIGPANAFLLAQQKQ